MPRHIRQETRPWYRRPRYPVDWNGLHRVFVLVALLVFALGWGGLAALTGNDRNGNRLVGALCLLGCLVLLAGVGAYLHRPASLRRSRKPLLRDDIRDL